jgi:hypothetical protein
MLVVVVGGALDSIVGVPEVIEGTIRRDSDAVLVLSNLIPQFPSARPAGTSWYQVPTHPERPYLLAERSDS